MNFSLLASYHLVKTYRLTALFLLLFLSEAIYKVVSFNHLEFRLAAIVKILIQIYIIYFIIINKVYSKIWHILIIVFLFMIGQISLVDKSNLFENILFIDRYLFVLFLLVFINHFKPLNNDRLLFLKVYEKVILFNSILIIVGFLFDIYFLKSYKWGRFGFNGLLIKSGSSTFIYCISNFYFLYKVLVLKENKFPQLFLVLGASFFLGTKSIFLFNFLILCYFFLKLKYYRKLPVLAGIVLLIIFFVTYKSSFITLFKHYFSEFFLIMKQKGFLSALTSHRSELFLSNFKNDILYHWNGFNYLFGGSLSMSHRCQFEFFDMFYFFGMIGSAFYLFVFHRNYVLGKLAL